MKLYFAKFDNANKTNRTIGKSVIRGEIAIFIPSFIPYFIVSEKTSARRGPGEIPVAKPRTIPETRNLMPSITQINIGRHHMKLSNSSTIACERGDKD